MNNKNCMNNTTIMYNTHDHYYILFAILYDYYVIIIVI